MDAPLRSFVDMRAARGACCSLLERKLKKMFEKKIRLSDTDEVKDFVDAAGKCDFDIDVFYNRAVIDAKSLLGMLYLGIGTELTIKYGVNDLAFEENIQKYAVC